MLAQQLHTAYRTANNFYPTPAQVAERLIRGLVVQPGDVLLEPSAGKGNIAEVLRKTFPENPLYCAELHPLLCGELRAKGFQVIEGNIFDHHATYDVIVANPPFCDGFQDIDHFMHYWSLLKPHGRIACILHQYSAFPERQFGKPYLFSKFLTAIGARREFLGSAFSNAERATNTGIALVWAERKR